MQFEAGIFRGMELLNTVELVYVFADAATQTPQPLPQAMRDVLTAFEAGQEVVSLRSGSWNDLGREAERLRMAVFVKEQGVPREIEIDEFDPIARHVVLLNALQQPVATGRLVSDAPGVGRIGRMAVDRGVRGGRWGAWCWTAWSRLPANAAIARWCCTLSAMPSPSICVQASCPRAIPTRRPAFLTSPCAGCYKDSGFDSCQRLMDKRCSLI